jgi:penicillin-binding protein 1A
MRDNGGMRRRGARWIAVVVATTWLCGACAYSTRDIAPRIPANAQSSQVFAADGSLITILHGEQNRQEIPLARIPRSLQDAVVAIEDSRFWEHKGIDVRAVLRAMRTNADQGDVAQGGSTITQQFVKTTILGDEKTVKRKVQEALLAVQLERKYTKQRILELYLNTIYFGNGAYGVEAAADEYFGKQVGDLTVAESAMLAGVIHAPAADDPYDHPDVALARRNVVLDRMGQLGMLAPADVLAAKATPVQLAPAAAQLDQRYPAAHFVEEVKQFILHDPRFGDTPADRVNLLFNGGLRIYTTVDLKLQQEAEAAINKILPDAAHDPQAALVSVDPTTGYVKAMVGGRDFFSGNPAAKVNLAMGQGRPTGSSFKPFVLAQALQEGIPLTEVLPAPGEITINVPGDTKPWNVHNADPGESHPEGVDLVEGTVHSYNTLFAQLIMQVGPQKAVDLAKSLGVVPPAGLQAVPSAVLGANNVRVLDMASAYGTFANRGVSVDPVMVTRITRPDGTVLYEAQHEQHKAIDVGIADQVTSVLQQVIQRGTGTAAQLGRPAAGKTGTGQDYADAWFCGYTPQLATAVWVGFHQGEVSMAPPTTRIKVFGGTWPAQIWHDFMGAALATAPPTDFAVPTAPTTTLSPTTTTIATGTTLGPAAAVPKVIGLSSTDAQHRLTQAGFAAEQVVVNRTDVAPGTVTNQSPAGGASAPTGSTVVLEVAGRASSGDAVPNVVGQTVDRATATLQNAGFGANVVHQANAAVAAGVVWLQDPPADDRAPKGTTVTLWVNG